MSRFRIVPERSVVFIGAKSSLHPINTRTDGLEGYLELDLGGDGALELGVPPAGSLSLPVTRLSSGNVFEDREMRRRIDARRYPTIQGDLVEMQRADNDERYRVLGDLTCKGVTNRYEDEMRITAIDEHTLRLQGEATFDVREFGIEPPRRAVAEGGSTRECARRDRGRARGGLTMCLGIPGQVVELLDAHEHLARVDVSGVGRVINIGLLEDEALEPGNWVLIHVGFAMSKVDEEEARRALEGLQLMGQAYTDEMDALASSQIELDVPEEVRQWEQ